MSKYERTNRKYKIKAVQITLKGTLKMMRFAKKEIKNAREYGIPMGELARYTGLNEDFLTWLAEIDIPRPR